MLGAVKSCPTLNNNTTGHITLRAQRLKLCLLPHKPEGRQRSEMGWNTTAVIPPLIPTNRPPSSKIGCQIL